MKIALLVAATFASTLLVSSQTTSAADGWMTVRQAKSVLNKMNKSGMIPASMNCRNSPSAGKRLKPEIKLSFKKNSQLRKWTIFAQYGHLNWRPGNIGDKSWKKRYGVRLSAPASGRNYNCSLWYGAKIGPGQKRYGTIQTFEY